MAFAGIHIACGMNLMFDRLAKPVWSRSLATAGTTNRAAAEGQDVWEITASADSFVAIGPTPDASQAEGEGASARILLRAGERRSFQARPGDRVAWVPVP